LEIFLLNAGLIKTYLITLFTACRYLYSFSYALESSGGWYSWCSFTWSIPESLPSQDPVLPARRSAGHLPAASTPVLVLQRIRAEAEN